MTQKDPHVELTFADLIAPYSVEEFFEKYWNKAPLVISRKDPDYYGSLFTMDDVDRSVYSARQCNQKNLNIIPPPGSDRSTQNYLPGSLAPQEMYKAFNQGDSIRFMAVQASWPPVAKLSGALSETFNAKVNVNFYLTPEGSQAFPVHIDTHDVIVLQVAGAKNWFVYETDDYRLPLNTLGIHQDDMAEQYKSPLDEDEVTLWREFVLEQGDFLFMPRGVPHKAVAVPGEPSLHLTIGIHNTFWVDYAKAAMEWLSVHNDSFREPLPRDFSSNPESVAALSEHFIGILQEALKDASFEKTGERLGTNFAKARVFQPDGHFSQLVQSKNLDADTVVEHRPGLVCTTKSDEEAARILYGGHEVNGPARLAKIFDFIRDTRSFRLGDMPGLDPKSCAVLGRRLVREGLLRVVETTADSANAAEEVAEPALA